MMGAGRFDNVFKRISVELDRMLRIGMPKADIDTIKEMLLKHRPKNQEDFIPPSPRNGPPVTPYALAVNRYEGFKEGKYTWEYVLEMWEKCSPDDQARLNEVFQGN